MRITISTEKRCMLDLKLWERWPEPEPEQPRSPISHLGFASTETRWQDDE